LPQTHYLKIIAHDNTTDSSFISLSNNGAFEFSVSNPIFTFTGGNVTFDLNNASDTTVLWQNGGAGGLKGTFDGAFSVSGGLSRGDNTINSGGLSESVTAVQTTNATPTTLQSFAVSANECWMVHTEVVGRITAGGDRAIYILSGCFYRDGAGLVQQGTTASHNTTESNAAWNCDLVVSGNNILVQVTGAVATTINWKSCTRLMRTT
jgi:hypothetical protein